MKEKVASCRICAGQCSLRFMLDETDRIIQIRGDKANPITRGYACIKGLTLHDAHYSSDRILYPLKRQADGNFQRISLAAALDEIAASINSILDTDGPDAIGGFRGTMNYTNSIANQMLPDWLAAMGSHSFFSTMTIDQSAKWVTAGRLGTWQAGKDPYEQSDVLLCLGANPLVSLSTFNFVVQNPAKAIRDARARGLKIIVIDPRFTETARQADLFVQPLPGEDPTLLAGMIRMILINGWQDHDFCAAHVAGLDELRDAVAPFTPEYVEARAGISQAVLAAVAEMFTKPFEDGRRKRGSAASGTGPNMAPHSNLTEHLLECLNVVCGRFARPGDRVPNPGVLGLRWQRQADVVAPARSWESGWRDAQGFGLIFGERMSGNLPDAIQGEGPGKLRAMIVDGGNPVNSLAGSERAAQAFAALDLLVVIDPFMNETAALADYILPPPMMLERPDIANRDYESYTLMQPYAQYSMPVIAPPPDSELIEDWRVFWELAQRTGQGIVFDGIALDMAAAPDAETLINILLRHSSVPVDEIIAACEGRIFDVEPMYVREGSGTARFEIAPPDIIAELATVFEEAVINSPFRFAVRRVRDVQNTMHHHLPEIVGRMQENPLWLHPDSMAALGLANGERVCVWSEHGFLEAIVEADPTQRIGVAAMTHGWGFQSGVNVNQLTSIEKNRDPINAMPVLSGFPVWIEKLV